MSDSNKEILRLINLKERLKEEFEKKNKYIKKTEEKNKNFLNEIENYKAKIKELEKENEILKTAKTISLTDKDKTEVKNKINNLIREIDKSIGLLNE